MSKRTAIWGLRDSPRRIVMSLLATTALSFNSPRQYILGVISGSKMNEPDSVDYDESILINDRTTTVSVL